MLANTLPNGATGADLSDKVEQFIRDLDDAIYPIEFDGGWSISVSPSTGAGRGAQSKGELMSDMATEPNEPSEAFEAWRNLMLTLMREYQAAIDAAFAAERAGNPLLAHDKAISVSTMGEVITTLLTALDVSPAMRGAFDQTRREWLEMHAQDVARLAHLCQQIN